MPRRTTTTGFSLMPHSVLLDPSLTLAQKVLVGVILAYDWKDGCFASIGTMALQANCSASTARTALRGLEACGHIRREVRHGRPSVYYIADRLRPQTGKIGP